MTLAIPNGIPNLATAWSPLVSQKWQPFLVLSLEKYFGEGAC